MSRYHEARKEKGANKRQRKKQQKKKEQQDLEEWRAFSLGVASPRQKRLAYFEHPRRRWLSAREWKRRKAQLQADREAEKAVILEKLKTHYYMLAGWVPKPQSKV